MISPMNCFKHTYPAAEVAAQESMYLFFNSTTSYSYNMHNIIDSFILFSSV